MQNTLCYSLGSFLIFPMALSSFSLILGVTYYLFGFPFLFSEKSAIAWRRKLSKDGILVRLCGAVFVMLAALTLKTQYLLTPDAEGLVILFAWLTFIKALLLVWWPELVTSWKTRFDNAILAHPTLHVGVALVMIFLGALFTYLGIVLV